MGRVAWWMLALLGLLGGSTEPARAQCAGTLLSDGGFESGGVGWEQTTGSSGVVTAFDPGNAVSGNWLAKFGNGATLDTYFLSQTLVVPSGYSAELRFYVRHGDLVTGDFFQVAVDGKTQFEITPSTPGFSSYVDLTLDIGQTANNASHTVLFFAQTQGVFFVDDVCLTPVQSDCLVLQEFGGASATNLAKEGSTRSLQLFGEGGIRFSGPAPNSGPFIAAISDYPRVGNFRDTRTLAWDTARTYPDGTPTGGPIYLEFADPVDAVRIRCGTGDASPLGGSQLSAFDLDGNELLTRSLEQRYPSMQTVRIDAPGIKRIAIDFTTQTFLMDDICVTTDPGPIPCFDNSTFSQRPANRLTYETYPSDVQSGVARLDNFSGVEAPIQRVMVFGIYQESGSPDICFGDSFPKMRVSLFADNAGQPGAGVFQEIVEMRGDLSRPVTLDSASQRELQLYAELSEPVNLSVGWIRIENLDYGDCKFRWAEARPGDGDGQGGTMDGFGEFTPDANDLAFCIAPTAGQPSPRCDTAPFSQPPVYLWSDRRIRTGAISPLPNPRFGTDLQIDDFESSGPFQRIRWWGFQGDGNATPCAGAVPQFELWLWPESQTPGTPSTKIPLAATETATSFIMLNNGELARTVFEYEADLPEPVAQSSGWLAIVDTANTICGYHWLSGIEGNDVGWAALQPNVANLAETGDMAFCLETLDVEGEGEEDGVQTSDQDGNFIISLSELLRVIQFYNAGGLHCADNPGDTEDGYVSGPGANQTCTPYDTDYNPQNWVISLSELLRVIQFYNAGGYNYCPLNATEDGFCPGL